MKRDMDLIRKILLQLEESKEGFYESAIKINNVPS